MHRTVMAARSPFMRKMLLTDWLLPVRNLHHLYRSCISHVTIYTQQRHNTAQVTLC